MTPVCLYHELSRSVVCSQARKSADACGYLLHLVMKKEMDLRYGENPHQRAALYGSFHDSFEKLHGKELSYNNILEVGS